MIIAITDDEKTKLTTNADVIVATDAPMNPSHVFLGDNLINGVLPKKKPNIYAAISLITISVAGRRNLHQQLSICQGEETT